MSQLKKSQKTRKKAQGVTIPRNTGASVPIVIENGVPVGPHGKQGFYSHHFSRLEVGGSFVVPQRDYHKASSARAHFQKKHKVKIKSRVMLDSETNKPIIVNGEKQYRFYLVAAD